MVFLKCSANICIKIIVILKNVYHFLAYNIITIFNINTDELDMYIRMSGNNQSTKVLWYLNILLNLKVVYKSYIYIC